jgi:hypothetical protein
MNTTQTKVLKRIGRQYGGPGAVVTAKDFLDLASRDAVDQALVRLTKRGVLNRVGRGLYHRPRINQNLGIAVPPDADKVAIALGRQTGSRVVPSSAVAANRLGLSTQIPAKHVYFTDGKSRSVKVGSQTFRLKHVAPNKLPSNDSAVGRALQAIDTLGPDPDDQVIGVIQQMLSSEQRQRLLREARYSAEWVVEVARRIANSNHSEEMVAHG